MREGHGFALSAEEALLVEEAIDTIHLYQVLDVHLIVETLLRYLNLSIFPLVTLISLALAARRLSPAAKQGL